MADILTQLQDAIDNITLMYATINYIQIRHPYGNIPGQPSQAPPFAPDPVPETDPAAPLTNGNTTTTQPDATTQTLTTNPPTTQDTSEPRPPTPPPPHRPEIFNASLRELAQDIVVQEQQMEILINALPGLGSSEASQLRRMAELEEELRVVERERAEAEREREGLVGVLGEMVVGVRRVP